MRAERRREPTYTKYVFLRINRHKGAFKTTGLSQSSQPQRPRVSSKRAPNDTADAHLHSPPSGNLSFFAHQEVSPSMTPANTPEFPSRAASRYFLSFFASPSATAFEASCCPATACVIGRAHHKKSQYTITATGDQDLPKNAFNHIQRRCVAQF